MEWENDLERTCHAIGYNDALSVCKRSSLSERIFYRKNYDHHVRELEKIRKEIKKKDTELWKALNEG